MSSVMVPNARLGLQLGDKGVPQPGAPAMLWEAREAEEQRWRLEQGQRLQYSVKLLSNLRCLQA